MADCANKQSLQASLLSPCLCLPPSPPSSSLTHTLLSSLFFLTVTQLSVRLSSTLFLSLPPLSPLSHPSPPALTTNRLSLMADSLTPCLSPTVHKTHVKLAAVGQRSDTAVVT